MRYPKSRLPGPAVTLFDLEYRLELEREAQLTAFAAETVQVSFTAETIRVRTEKP